MILEFLANDEFWTIQTSVRSGIISTIISSEGEKDAYSRYTTHL